MSARVQNKVACRDRAIRTEIKLQNTKKKLERICEIWYPSMFFTFMQQFADLCWTVYVFTLRFGPTEAEIHWPKIEQMPKQKSTYLAMRIRSQCLFFPNRTHRLPVPQQEQPIAGIFLLSVWHGSKIIKTTNIISGIHLILFKWSGTLVNLKWM